jgi:hypothetical protein
MRRTLALLALLAVAAFWTGCGSDKSNNPTTNSTTTNSAATNSAAPYNSGASNANRGSSGTPPGAQPPASTVATPSGSIKPPM